MVSQRDVDLAVTARELLTHDDRLAAHALEVVALDKVITLKGSVQSHRRKLAALEIANSIAGCRGVNDEIKVDPPVVVSDDEVAENIRSILEAHSDITKEAITVTVKAGIARLQGNVSTRWERVLAEDLALSARGVRKVRNLLLVDPQEQVEAEALTKRIHHALAHASELQGQNIRVAVNASTAVLSGEVDELWQKLRAEEVASRFKVSEVKNEIHFTSH